MKYTGSSETAFKKQAVFSADAFNKGLTSVLSGRLKTSLAHSPELYIHCTTDVQQLNGVRLITSTTGTIGTTVTRDMCIKGRGAHITRNMCIFVHIGEHILVVI